MLNLNKIIFSGSLLLLLAACTSTKIAQTHQWQAQRDWQAFDASGRLGVKIDEKGSYANFDWTRKNGVETIDVNTPIGSTVGQLCRDAEGVLAQDANGKIYTAETPEELSEKLLGYHLPIKHLSVWANGEWVRDEPHSFTADGKLKQLGWTISRELNDDETTRILLLENDKMSLRMVFNELTRTQGQPESQERCAARTNML